MFVNELTYVQKKFNNYIETIMGSSKISHSYLIELGDFMVEFPFVLSFIKMILCPKHINKVADLDCSFCNVCKLIDKNEFPDLQIIEADGNQIKKSQLLSLKAEYQNKSLIGQRRVYIIKNAEKLNPSSANTILKFLEEPEEGIIAILLTNNRYQVLDTILSRCQVLSLVEEASLGEIDSKIVLFISYLVHPEELFINYKQIYESILPDKESAKSMFSFVEKIFLEFLSVDSQKELPASLSFFKEIDMNIILSYITIIEEEIPKLVYNINYKLWLDCIYSRFVEVR